MNNLTPQRSATDAPSAFSLIELLVVISIIALLTAIILPALGMARQQGRHAVCLSNLHQLGIGASMYLDDYDDTFWRYYQDVAGGRQWWFGFEAGGPGAGANRPLDLAGNVMADYLNPIGAQFQCPTFPYDHSDYFPKFDQHSASYGYNSRLGPIGGNPLRRTDSLGKESSVFIFGDSIHFDTNPGFNEGHYIEYQANTKIMSGYAHFRHTDQALAVMMDGHAQGQQLRGPAHTTAAGAAAGNLSDNQGTNRIYGF